MRLSVNDYIDQFDDIDQLKEAAKAIHHQNLVRLENSIMFDPHSVKVGKGTIIGLDFDGTVVTHEYPGIGEEIPHVFSTLKELNKRECLFILFTMRSGRYLTQAADYIESKGIPLFGVNTNPTQHYWTKSPKAHCNYYIDDCALGCPLIYPEQGRPYVDWLLIRRMLGC